MKKMKRFLSLLICMVMLMSFLPMSASAAPVSSMTVKFSKLPAAGENIDPSVISLENARWQKNDWGYEIKPTISMTGKYQEGNTYTIVLKVRPLWSMNQYGPNWFTEPLTVNVPDGITVSSVNVQNNYNSYGWLESSNATITLSVTIPKSHTHTYDESGFNRENDSQHWRECTATDCPDRGGSATGHAPHNYVGELIEDGNQHYNECVCGKKNYADHAYDTTTWSKDGEKHWHACECGAKSDENPHVYDGWNDERCNVCDHEREVHQHDLDYTYEDGTGHWQECSIENCPALESTKTELVGHIFDGWDDELCDTCGYTRQIHQHDLDYTYEDGTGHWQECSIENCPALESTKTEVVGHVFDGWDDELCDPCGYTRQIHQHDLDYTYEDGTGHWQVCSIEDCPDANKGKTDLKEHEFDNWQDDKCDTCGYTRQIHRHDLDYTYEDGTGHWQECSIENCPDANKGKTDPKEHEFDDWQDNKCDTCGYTRQIHRHDLDYTYEDGTGHWKQCGDPECPDVEHSKTPKVDHRYGHGYWDPICDDCGFTRFYIVKFDVTNWYDYNDQRVDAGDTADRPHAPDINGLTLDGWYTNPECTEKYDFTTPVNTSFTLFAKWVPITHDVTFNGNNFTVAINGSEVEDNKYTVNENGEVEFTITADEGYEITEVKIDGQKVTLAENGEYTISNITSDKRVDITATPITYEVTFTGNNFTVAIGENEDVDKHTVNYKGEVEFTVTPDEGYKVTGVKVGEDTLTATGGVYTISNITSDKTVEISTERITYTINYDAKGGTGAPAAQIKNHGEVLTLSTTVPTREGYEFVCWNTMADYTGTDFEAGASYSHNGGCTLRAKWTKVYTISYELNGGALKTGETNPDKYTALTETFKLNNPEKENFTFAGWTEGNDTTPNTNVTIEKGSTGDRKYTAHWTQNSYTVVFYGNGGTLKAKTADEATDTQVIKIGEEAALKENPFTRTGYTFAGWNTERDGSGKSYGDGEKVKNLTTTDGAEVALYAQWTQNSYTVKFDTNGKGTAPEAQTVLYGNTASKPVGPSVENYTLVGWYTDKDCTIEYVFETPVTGDITLYAKWTKTIYKVTYDANGGTGEMPVVNVEAGEGHTLVANEFKAPAGKTFKCWKVGLKEYKAGEKIDVTENVTVKAVWKNKTASSDLDYVPAAGDNFPTFLWAGLLLFSVVALVEVVVLRRKRS